MSEPRTLPPWDPNTSDGCSALPFGRQAARLRVNMFLFRDKPEARAACEAHDEAYYYGGTEEDRLLSDNVLLKAWEEAGVSWFVRTLGYRLIRLFGGPGARTTGVSWAFGGEYFQYSERPAVPAPVDDDDHEPFPPVD
jgi:hypothetical protein